MKILRLTNSADLWPGVSADQRTAAVLSRSLRGRTGEEVEIIPKVVWPTPRLPGVVDRLIDEFQPDIVFLWINPFWYAYASVPVLLDRRLGRTVGGRLAVLSRKAAMVDWSLLNGVVRVGRRVARRTIGASFYHQPDEVIAVVEAIVRGVVRREDVVLAVWGPPFCVFHDPDGDRTAWSEDRRREVNAALRKLCREHRVLCEASDDPHLFGDGAALTAADGMHANARGHEVLAELQLDIHIAAWRSLREGVATIGPHPATP